MQNLRRFGINGPYTIADINLYLHGKDERKNIGSREEVHTTAAYSYDDFQTSADLDIVGIEMPDKKIVDQPIDVMISIRNLGTEIAEDIVKIPLFRCQRCGECILSHTAFICSQRCPKKMRNGPCDGVRSNGHCEVIPERFRVWLQAWECSRHMRRHADDLQIAQPPVDYALQNTSGWVNVIEERDVPPDSSRRSSSSTCRALRDTCSARGTWARTSAYTFWLGLVHCPRRGLRSSCTRGCLASGSRTGSWTA